MIERNVVTALVLGSLGLISGCGGGGAQSIALPEPDQTNICEANDVAVATNCKTGQKIVFLPAQFGNAQLPVYFAAANCDLRYSVVLTNGAVTCIFKPIKVPEESRAASAPSSQGK